MIKIPLNLGKVVLIDDQDFEIVSKHRWYAVRGGNTFYASAHPSSSQTIYLHRLLLAPPLGLESDHKDGNGLNNCRDNLRICTRSQNLANRRPWGRSPFKGVSRETANRWRAQICINKKIHYLGLFNSEIDAALAYDLAATKLHGEFARLNGSSSSSSSSSSYGV